MVLTRMAVLAAAIAAAIPWALDDPRTTLLDSCLNSWPMRLVVRRSGLLQLSDADAEP